MLRWRIYCCSLALIGAVFASTALGAAGPAQVTPGHYHCSFATLNGVATNQPGFTIATGGTYQDENGSQGRFSYDPAQALITFQGGSRDGQAGQVGQRVIQFYNERRSRILMGCEAE